MLQEKSSQLDPGPLGQRLKTKWIIEKFPFRRFIKVYIHPFLKGLLSSGEIMSRPHKEFVVANEFDL